MHRQPDPFFFVIRFDQFSAQVLAAYHPNYRNLPFVVIHQNADDHRCIVQAASMTATARGICPGIPVHQVRRRFTDIAIFRRVPEMERALREELADIFNSYTPSFRIRSNGTCILDLTGTPCQRCRTPAVAAQELKNELHKKTGLSHIAVGMGNTRVYAEIMAQLALPSGIRGSATGATGPASLSPMLLPGLSPQCREKLTKYGFTRIDQIEKVGKDALIKRFGREGEKLYSLAHGLESRSSTRNPVSYSAETVLEKDINDMHILHRYIRYTADKLCYLLKEHELVIDRFSFHLTYTDNKKTQKTKRFSSPTADFLKLTHSSEQLFEELYQRRVGIKSIKLVAPSPESDPGQIDLFETTWDQKQQALGRGIADLRKRIGFSAVMDANTVTLKPKSHAQK